MKSTKTLYVGVIATVLILTGTITYAQLADATINACVSKIGLIRIIPEGKPVQCLKHETLLTWNTSGSQGAKGDQGEMGPIGPQGEVGPVGPQGEAGSVGPQGEVGPKGDKGDMGDTGSQGPKGEQGATGPQGERGEKGEPGETASLGSGNIAFISGDKLLKTDGTVWVAGTNPGSNPPFTLIDCTNFSGVTNVPIPISKIRVWQYKSLIDIDGNYWYTTNTCPHNWQNLGPLP